MEEHKLNKLAGISILLVFASMFFGTVAAINNLGPAPNSGDGISDGSGFEPATSAIELVIVLVILLVSLVLIFFLFKRRKTRTATIRHKEPARG